MRCIPGGAAPLQRPAFQSSEGVLFQARCCSPESPPPPRGRSRRARRRAGQGLSLAGPCYLVPPRWFPINSRPGKPGPLRFLLLVEPLPRRHLPDTHELVVSDGSEEFAVRRECQSPDPFPRSPDPPSHFARGHLRQLDVVLGPVEGERLAVWRPGGDTAAPLSFRTSLPVATSQSRMVLSSLPETSSLPLGENATALT